MSNESHETSEKLNSTVINLPSQPATNLSNNRNLAWKTMMMMILLWKSVSRVAFLPLKKFWREIAVKFGGVNCHHSLPWTVFWSPFARTFNWQQTYQSDMIPMVTHATWHVQPGQGLASRSPPYGTSLTSCNGLSCSSRRWRLQISISSNYKWMRRKLTYSMEGIRVSLNLGFVGGLLHVG